MCCSVVLIRLGVYTFLIALAVCENRIISPYGEPLGPLGPTIVEKPNNIDDDIKLINSSIIENNLEPVIKLIVNRTLAQRLSINDAYKKKFSNKNVTTDINTLLVGRGNELSIRLFGGMFTPLPEYLARCIRESLDQRKDWLFLSIPCTSSATKLKAINKAYFEAYGMNLSDDISGRPKERLDEEGKNVLLQMLNPKTMRPDNGTDTKSSEDLVKFIPGIENQGCRDKTLFELMTQKSFEQIKDVAAKYSEGNVVDAFRRNCDPGVLQEAYKRIVRYATDPYEYFAEELYLGLKMNEYNTNSHIYVITTRNEVDLRDVIEAYRSKYKINLVEKVKAWEKSEEYNQLFLYILQGNR